MTSRVTCKKLFCRVQILEETAIENGGLCGRCFRQKYPEKVEQRKRDRDQAIRDAHIRESSLPVSELSERQLKSQLRSAIYKNDLERINEILALGNGVISRPPDSSATWLGEAVSRNCSISVLERLISAGCNPNDQPKSTETTPLVEAVTGDRFEAIEFLLQNGADPNVGRPVVCAVHYEKLPDVQLKLLRLLVVHGADLNRKFELLGDKKKSFTVLDWAEMYGVPVSVLEFLKANGAENHWDRAEIDKRKKELAPRRIVP